jgi:hypothetical protein
MFGLLVYEPAPRLSELRCVGQLRTVKMIAAVSGPSV